jgi:hypothetical protein
MARTESITPEKKEILLAVYDNYRKARDLEGRCVQGSNAAKKAKTQAEAAIGLALNLSTPMIPKSVCLVR